MQVLDPEILGEFQGLSANVTVPAFALGFLIWLLGWRGHRFWIVLAATVTAGLIGLDAGPSWGSQRLVAGLLLAVAAGTLALSLVRVVAFAAGGAAGWLIVHALAPQWNDPLVCFLGGGILGLLLYRLWSTSPLGGLARFAPITPIALFAVLTCPVSPSVNWLYESLVVVVAFPLIVRAAALDAPGPRTTAIYLFLGRLSYPLYILHYPLIRVFSNFARAHDLHGTQFWLLIAAEILCAICFSLVVIKLFDEPVRDWLGRKWRSWRQSAVSDER